MHYGPLIISINGLALNNDIQARLLQDAYVGGVILTASNHKNLEQLQNLTSQINQIAIEANKELIIMVDHEGGYVQRFRTGFYAAPAEHVLGEIYDLHPETALTYANHLGTIVGNELKSAGVDVILGPVVDLDLGNSVISDLHRAYHSDPHIVSEIATAYLKGLESSEIAATLKHFPGHGADVGDSHISSPIDNRTFEELLLKDLVPFQDLIQNDLANAIMPAHITYPQIDSENTAGTSKIWLNDILRDEMHFDGVIISDCLSMDGAGFGTNLDKVLKALEYGDLALLSNQTPEQYADLLGKLHEQAFTWSPASQTRVEQWLAPTPVSELSTQPTVDIL